MESKDIKVTVAEERDIFEKLLGGVPQALYIESGGIKETKKPRKDNPYETTSYADETDSGLLGGKARLIAASEIAKAFPQLHLVTSSKDNINAETHAKVMAYELEQRYGIDKSRISLEEKSTSTLTELVEMIKMSIRNGWSRVSVLTNDYHLARNYEMYDHIEQLADPNDVEFKQSWPKFKDNVTLTFIGAESILPFRYSRYSSLISNVEETESYKRRLEFEARGVKAIEERVYKSDPTVNVLKTK